MPQLPLDDEPTHDLQRTTAFTYWRCGFNHGRLISFDQFLQIDALLALERQRLHAHEHRDTEGDLVAVGAQAIGALIGAFLTLSH